MHLRHRALATALLCAGITAAPAPAGAQDTARGRALYEARCDRCHETSVHQRSRRAAGSFAEIRGYVVRWDRELGPIWTREDIDAVTRWLNERYYRYPCPTEVCKAERA